MIKYIRLLLLLVVVGGCASLPAEKLFLGKEDCANIAMAAGLMQEYINQGDKHPLSSITKGASEELPPALKNHLSLMETYQLKFKGADPQTVMESYLNFCMAAKGDMDKMEEVIKKGIERPVGESV